MMKISQIPVKQIDVGEFLTQAKDLLKLIVSMNIITGITTEEFDLFFDISKGDFYAIFDLLGKLLPEYRSAVEMVKTVVK